MKNFFLSLVVAALFGVPFATARDATDVQVTLKQQAGKPVAVHKLAAPGNVNFGTESVMQQHKTGGWHVVNIPLEVEGYTKKKDENGNYLPVHFIPSLTVKVYLLFKHEDPNGKEKPKGILLSKELKYVNIPIPSAGKKKGVRMNEIYAGVFISPADAWKISEKTKGELSGTLVAYAVDASYKEASSCMNADKDAHPQYCVIDNKLERTWNLNGKWWNKSGDTMGASLKSISETPYAMSYGNFYPEMSPIVSSGAAPVMGSTPLPSMESSSLDSTATSADATTTDSSSATEESAGVEADAESTTGKKNRGKNKNRRSRR